MPDQVIVCPKCRESIPLSEAISHQMRETLLKELEAESARKNLDLAQKEQALFARTRDLEKSKLALEESRKSLDQQIRERLAGEREKIQKDALTRVEEKMGVEVKDLRVQLEEKSRLIADAQRLELDLRKQRRDLEERQKSMEVEMVRRLDEERTKVREEAVRGVQEETRLKALEKDKKIEDLARQLDDMKRKVEQGSQQTQGEVLELEVEALLKSAFPFDQVEPVSKGIRGADVIQRIINPAGQVCGTIIWEMKRAKVWSDAWISKLKDDQRSAKADLAVLLSTALPPSVLNFQNVQGVWVTNHACLIGLAAALRANLIQVAAAKVAAEGKHEKMEILYRYLAGNEFKQRVEGIVEAFDSMKKQLDVEKRALMKNWAQREKEIDRAVINTVGMYGDFQGIIGGALPPIKELELESSASPALEERPARPEKRIEDSEFVF